MKELAESQARLKRAEERVDSERQKRNRAILRALEQGTSVSAVARELGVSRRAVAKVRDAQG